jgi:hypothetical protein
MHEQQVLGEHAVTCDVGERRERSGRDGERTDGQPVETVGQVHRI